MNRRDFIAAASRGAAATVAVASPIVVAASAAGSTLHDRFGEQFESALGALGERMDAFTDDLRAVGSRVQRLELQQQVLLFLLLLSFVLDGGLTWLVMHAPVVPLV